MERQIYMGKEKGAVKTVYSRTKRVRLQEETRQEQCYGTRQGGGDGRVREDRRTEEEEKNDGGGKRERRRERDRGSGLEMKQGRARVAQHTRGRTRNEC